MKTLGILLAGAFTAAALIAQTTPGFDPAAIDRSADPCTDFYRYACGTWMANNPVPADQPSWGRFSELAERNRAILRQILEQASATKQANADTQKIGDYFAACMDQAAIDSKGLAPIQPIFNRIDAMKSTADLAGVVAEFHRSGIDVLFNFSSGQDFKDSNAVIGQADQGGLGLPEKDYYFRTDAKSVDTRNEYVAHLTRLLVILGKPQEEAHKQAEDILALETAIAKVSLDVTTRRDPEKVYHIMKLTEFEALADSFNWSRYFAAMPVPKMAMLNVASPDFFKGIQALLASQPLPVWNAYLKVHLVRSQAQMLPTKFDNEVFAFDGKYLQGSKEQRVRWKRCVDAVDSDLGEALGKAYVAKTFGEEGKARMLDMVKKLEAAMNQDIETLPWMTPATKQKALEKLHAIVNKIGYPDRWRDYSALKIARNDALGDSLRGTAFEVARQLRKIGKPVDRTEWFMTPPTVNAYYDPQNNSINFPAGILQPPFFDKQATDAVNYGAIGAVIGHEMTHGFDDEGRQFDLKGNLEDWWTEADAKAFEERADCLVDEYGSFDVGGGVHLNGKLTLGENTADNGGLRLAWIALMKDLAGKTLPPAQGFTTDQQFFLGFGQIWCNNATEEFERLRAQTDPHSLARFRVNGAVSNMPEFQSAFSCSATSPMVRPQGKACRVW